MFSISIYIEKPFLFISMFKTRPIFHLLHDKKPRFVGSLLQNGPEKKQIFAKMYEDDQMFLFQECLLPLLLVVQRRTLFSIIVELSKDAAAAAVEVPDDPLPSH